MSIKPTRLLSGFPLLAVVFGCFAILGQLQRGSSSISISSSQVSEDDESANITVDKACVQRALGAVQTSCDALSVAGQPQRQEFNTTVPTRGDPRSVRVTVSSLVHACVQIGDETSGVRRLRVIAASARIFPVFRRLGAQFSAATGIPLYFNYTTVLGSNTAAIAKAMLAPPPVRDTTDESGGVDAIITVPTYMPLLAQAGKLLDINKLVESDLQLKWFEISSTLRSQMVVYGNEVVAIPVTTTPTFLFYHAPTFKRDALQVPVTWDQVLALAEAYNGKDINGDGLPDYGICMIPPNCFADGVLLRWVFSSFVQTQGSSQGMFFDSASMANLANSSAMAEALMVLRRLRLASGQPRGDCTKFEIVEYLQGRCLLALTTHMTFKAAYSPDSPSAYAAMRGNMGMTGFPGSTRVLDRATGQMVDCDETICPLAYNKAPDAMGVVRPVNQPLPSSNVIVLINAQSPPKYQFYAYSLFSYLTSPLVLGTEGEALLLDPRLETAPLRNTDLAPESAALWVARGYHPSDVEHFFTAWRAAQANPNQAFEPRFPGVPNVSLAFAAAAALYVNTTPGYQLPPVTVPLSVITRTVEAVIVEQGGQETFTRAYRQTLNWVPPPPPPPPMGDGDHVDHARRARTIAPAVVPCGLAALLLGSLTLAALWRQKLKSRQLHALVAPGHGPDTTILVTDIQSSTSLWEHLDAGVMDQALSVHHTVIRMSITKWEGYESATEGDSFIVAFSNPTAAINFAVKAQQALLNAPWPPGLLNYPPLPGLEGDDDPLGQVAAQPLARHLKATAARPRAGAVGSAAVGQRVWPSNHPPYQEANSTLRLQKASLSFFRRLSASALRMFASSSQGQGREESTGSDCGATVWPWYLNPSVADANVRSNCASNPHRLALAYGSTSRDMPYASQSEDTHDVQLRDRQSPWPIGPRSAVLLDTAVEATTAETLAGKLQASVYIIRGADGIGAPQHANVQDGSLPSGSSIPGASTAVAPASSTTNTVLLFRGLRVRMGMWTGVASAAEVGVNAATCRTQYSGECMRAAKAVADTAHGGMVVFTEASRVRLDPVAVRSFQHVILYGGLQTLNVDGGARQLQLHLYTAYSRGLLPRAVVVRPLRTAGELRPGALAAPVGHGALVQMKVVGAELLLAWNAGVAGAAVNQLHDTALALLPCTPMASDVDGGECGSAYVATGCASLLPGPLAASTCVSAAPGVMAVVFPDADGAVSWAAAVRRAALELEWPPELLEHELAEEVWTYAFSDADFGCEALTAAVQRHSDQLAAERLSPKLRPWELNRSCKTSSTSQGSLRGRIFGNRLRALSNRLISSGSRFAGGVTSLGFGRPQLQGSPYMASQAGDASSGAYPTLSRPNCHSSGAHQPTSMTHVAATEVAVQRGAMAAPRRAFSQGARTFRSVMPPSTEASSQGIPSDRCSPAHASCGGATAAEVAAVEPVALAAGLWATGISAPDRDRDSRGRKEGTPTACVSQKGDPKAAFALAAASSAENPVATADAALAEADVGSPYSAHFAPRSTAPIAEEDTVSEASFGVTAGDEERLSTASSYPNPGPADAPFLTTVPPRPKELTAGSCPVTARLRPASACATRSVLAAAPLALVPRAASEAARARNSALGTHSGEVVVPPGAKEHAMDSLASDHDGGAAAGMGGAVDRRLPQVDSVLVPRLLYRGLRLRWGVACGPLKGGLAAGDVSGQVSYGGKAAVAAAKLAARARAGQICATAALARTLPAALAAELTLVDKL